MDDAIAQFIAITDQSAQVAEGCLRMTEGDVMAAVNMIFENPEIASSFNQPSSAAAPAPAAAASSFTAPARPQAPAGNQDREVIQIDSDDDDAFEIPDDDDDVNHAEMQRLAQEDEDAAMARRLQEEMYGAGGATDPDGVRAPIQRTTETLVAPSGFGGVPDDADYHAFEHLHRRANRPRMSGNPFGQSIWEDDPTTARPSFAQAAGGSSNQQNSRAQRLADLFRPPYELMDHMSWDEARETGKESKKWILVNVQDMNDFNCQALNRDIWKDEAVVAVVKESFIFLQYSRDDHRATEYTTFYFPRQAQENGNNFPHVAIIDPRTGEQVKVWTGIPFPTARDFHAQLVEFLDRYSLSQNSKNPVSKQKAPQRSVDVDRMTEEEMLELAMRNSLETNGNGSSAALNVHDPDALTKSVELDKKGKGKAVVTAGESPDEVMGGVDESTTMDAAAASAETSAFAAIASDRPHTEPSGAGTTRIQFRHADGRMIRTFNLSDPVRRIYEWLKSQPLQGKEGVEFELKSMPQGQDLLGDLEKTIQEAGLKQATVMIEYIES